MQEYIKQPALTSNEKYLISNHILFTKNFIQEKWPFEAKIKSFIDSQFQKQFNNIMNKLDKEIMKTHSDKEF